MTSSSFSLLYPLIHSDQAAFCELHQSVTTMGFDMRLNQHRNRLNLELRTDHFQCLPSIIPLLSQVQER